MAGHQTAASGLARGELAGVQPSDDGEKYMASLKAAVVMSAGPTSCPAEGSCEPGMSAEGSCFGRSTEPVAEDSPSLEGLCRRRALRRRELKQGAAKLMA